MYITLYCDSHALCASSCMHALAVMCAVSCLVLCTNTRRLSVQCTHTFHLQHGDLFNGCYELVGCTLWMLLVMQSPVAVLCVLSAYTQYKVTVRSCIIYICTCMQYYAYILCDNCYCPCETFMCVDCSWTCGLCTVPILITLRLLLSYLQVKSIHPCVYMASNYSCIHTTISLPLAVKGSPRDPGIHYCEESQWIQLGPKAL